MKPLIIGIGIIIGVTTASTTGAADGTIIVTKDQAVESPAETANVTPVLDNTPSQTSPQIDIAPDPAALTPDPVPAVSPTPAPQQTPVPFHYDGSSGAEIYLTN